MKLGLMAAAATASVLAGTAFLTVRHFRGQLLRVVTDASSTESDVLRTVLEEQMMAGDRKLLRRLVSDIGAEPGIAWVGLIDKRGQVLISSDDRAVGHTFEVGSPDCQICHARAPAERLHSATIVRSGEALLRTVTPLVNRPACHACHDARNRLNGVLIIDRSLTSLQSAVTSSRTQVLAGSAAALFALLASLGFAVERSVLARLRRLRLAARRLGQGDLATRVVDAATDELGDLATDFNAMAARLAAALEGLAHEQRQLQALINGISDGVVVVDAERRIATTNRAFAARLPPGERAVPGSSYRDLVRATGLEDALSPAERAFRSGRLEKAIVRLGTPPDERCEEIYAHPIQGPDGTLTAVVEIWRDITDRMALEAGLAQSERLAALGVLASGVAHEVGNPLASIATAVEAVLRRADHPADLEMGELREYLQIVLKQVFRCRTVTQRLLGFARTPSSEPTVVDAAAAAREVMALVDPQARAQRVEVRTALSEPVFATAENMLIEQVVLNIVLNALQAMPEGGVLAVAARGRDDTVLVTVADTGPGIPESLKQHLFEPFRRARADGAGTGLGLFLSQTLLRRCGGRITVDSELGRGSVFTVHLHRSLRALAVTP